MTPNPSEVTQEDREAAVEHALLQVPEAYAEIVEQLSDAVVCYDRKDGGCIRESGCEDSCLMLTTYRKGVEFGARAAVTQAFAAHRLAERNACAQRATQILNSHPHAPPSPYEIIFAIRHPGEEA